MLRLRARCRSESTWHFQRVIRHASGALAAPVDADSRSWFQLSYPLGHVADIRLALALDWLLSKQDAEDRWKMEYTYNGKM